MKKIKIYAAALAALIIPFRVYAAEETADIHISIKMEETVLNTTLTVRDADKDGKLTVDDALCEAHERFYPGGAAAGFGDGFVWGRQCEGGYTLYNQDEMPPADDIPYTDRYEIRDGDNLEWSAQAIGTEYCTLYTHFFDQNWYEAPVVQGTKVKFYAVHNFPTKRGPEPVGGAEILIDGKKTGIRTDANGEALVALNTLGTHEITGDFPESAGCGQSAFSFTVVPAKSIVDTHIIIRLCNDDDAEPMVDYDLKVSDCDGDGRLTTYDALRLAHRYFGFPDAENSGLGQNRIWGRDGKFICEVYDGETLIRSGSAMDQHSERIELEAGNTVIFRPKDLLDDKIVPGWMDNAYADRTQKYQQGTSARIGAYHYLPDAVEPKMVRGAEVLIDGKETGIVTDAEGFASIPMMHPGEHTLSFKVSGVSKSAVESVMFEVVKKQSVGTPVSFSNGSSAKKTADSKPVQAMQKMQVYPVNTPADAEKRAQAKGVQTGDSMPVAAMVLAGMAAAAGVIALPNRKK